MTTLIAGLGNVLMGDDAIGPTLLHYLRARYEFAPDVELLDLGTPGLDLAQHMAGRSLVVILDAVDDPESEPGCVRVVHQHEMQQPAFAVRRDAHSPDLRESIQLAELHGSPPAKVVLLGITACRFGLGEPISPSILGNLDGIIRAVADQFAELQVARSQRIDAKDPVLWWLESTRAPEPPRENPGIVEESNNC